MNFAIWVMMRAGEGDPHRHAIMCQNMTGIDQMLAAAGQFRPSSGTLITSFSKEGVTEATIKQNIDNLNLLNLW